MRKPGWDGRAWWVGGKNWTVDQKGSGAAPAADDGGERGEAEEGGVGGGFGDAGEGEVVEGDVFIAGGEVELDADVDEGSGGGDAGG